VLKEFVIKSVVEAMVRKNKNAVSWIEQLEFVENAIVIGKIM
jgi:hypothetical protein